MNALLDEARKAGVQLYVEGNRLRVKGASISPELRARIVEHKAALLAELQGANVADALERAELEDENAREHFEERAAIHEYDAGMPRPEAERQAARAMVAYRTKHDPERELLVIAPAGETAEQEIAALHERFGDMLISARPYVPRSAEP